MKKRYQSFASFVVLAVLLITGCSKDEPEINHGVKTEINRSDDDHKNLEQQLDDLKNDQHDQHLK